LEENHSCAQVTLSHYVSKTLCEYWEYARLSQSRPGSGLDVTMRSIAEWGASGVLAPTHRESAAGHGHEFLI
jgi:hypothetical protein